MFAVAAVVSATQPLFVSGDVFSAADRIGPDTRGGEGMIPTCQATRFAHYFRG